MMSCLGIFLHLHFAIVPRPLSTRVLKPLPVDIRTFSALAKASPAPSVLKERLPFFYSFFTYPLVRQSSACLFPSKTSDSFSR
ncbi:hypothetical protein V8C44DRAFT_344057 [Trichoderma aethiopicum]